MSDSSSDDGDYDDVDFARMTSRYRLHDACEFGDIETLQALLSDDNNQGEESSSDDNDSTAAAHAAAIGHSPEFLKPVLDLNAEPAPVEPTNATPDEPMLPASVDPLTAEVAAELVKEPASPEQDKVQNNGQYRVPMGLNVNLRDPDENTPLHIAIHSRKLEHVKLLLQVGASVKLKCDGSWPHHTAISIGSLPEHEDFSYDCFVLLHQHGADLTLKDDSQHTALYLSCMYCLPDIVTYILSDEAGSTTLNVRSDRAGNRPLHIAAKFDSLYKTAAPKKTVVPSAFAGKLEATAAKQAANATTTTVTQILLQAHGIEVDATNSTGQSALHVACARGNWAVARLLLKAGSSSTLADKRGFTPGQLAHKRGMPIPNDLQEVLGEAPVSGIIPPPRDLIVDPDGSTLILSHELCTLHRTCPPIRRDDPDNEPPPENVRRLHVLLDEDTGILRTGEFKRCSLQGSARRAAMADVLKIHHYKYVERISSMASSIPDIPSSLRHLDADTAISRWSFEAAMRAAGSVCQAVDAVVNGESRNAFCAVRPPGHHAGPRGIVRCPNDPEGSHGFCLLNNVAIGAAYARSMYRNEGISKVAIIDFDVHHGNGTEEIIRQLVPTTERVTLTAPFVFGELSSTHYQPWLDETDIENVFFSSTHGYGARGYDQIGNFYPASGKTHTSEAIARPSMVEKPNMTEFILSQTWSRMGEDSKSNCCKIINVGFGLPDELQDPTGRSMKQRLELRETYRHKILPYLREFDPDLIFISAGFDAHKKDTMNFGYVGMVEEDYEWVTEQLVKVANTCCHGRIVSVLEGGYKIHGGIVSPFARSVAAHVRALVDGGRSRELHDPKDIEWESQYERHIYERRERKRDEDREKLRALEERERLAALEQLVAAGDVPEDPDASGSRKRRRQNVDYKELYKQMQQEGFGQ